MMTRLPLSVYVRDIVECTKAERIYDQKPFNRIPKPDRGQYWNVTLSCGHTMQVSNSALKDHNTSLTRTRIVCDFCKYGEDNA